MSYIQQFFTSRDNNANAETFVGQEGRLWWDPVTNQIYSSDGNTPGGIPLAGGGGGNGTPGGSNSQVQFNQNGTFGGSANVTIDRTTGALTAVSFVGNGAALTSITGANITGTVANATYADSAGLATSATTAGTVTTNAQPNITSVGTLTSITSTGNISTTGNVTGNYYIGNGSLLTGIASSSYGNANVATFLAAFGSNVISTTGNVTGGNLLTSGVVEFAGGSRLRPTGANLDIVAGAGSYVNLITSDDSSYMGVDGSGGYVVAAGRSWSFDTAGALTLPGATAGENIATQSGYITVGNLLVGAGGSLFNSNNDTWALYGNLSDPGVSITIPSNADAANSVPLNITSFSNVEISSGGTWAFNNDGTMTFPNNIINSNTNPITLWSTDSSSLLWRSPTGGGPSVPVQTTVSAENGNATISVATGTVSIQSIKTWTFDTAGNTTFPDATVQTTAYPGTSTSFSVSGNVTGGNVIGTTGVSVSGTGGDLTMTGGAITGVGNITSNGIMAINAPGGITTTQTSFDIVNATATTVNLGGSATAVNIGATTGTLTLNNPVVVGTQATQNVFHTTATAVNAFGAATAITMGATSGTLTLRNPTIVGSQTTQNLFNTVATTVNFAGAATTLNIGGAGNATFSANTQVRVSNTSGTALSVAGNITGGNVLSNGQLSAAGNITGARLALGGDITTPGNIGASYINGAYYTGTWSTNFQAIGNISTVANVISGNILTSGLISATGNITGGNILGGANVNSTLFTGTTASLSGNVTGDNVIAISTVYGNAATAFVAGSAAISGIALQLPSEGALRNLTNGLTNMYFDVSIGGTTQGQFQFRSSSSFTNVLTMSPTAFNVNTEAVVTAKTASFGRLPWNSAIDTELTIDDYRWRITNSGGIYPQVISNTGGTKNSAWTAVAAISGSAITQGGSTGILLPNNSWTTLYTFGSMASAGDTVTVTFQDKSQGRIYRVTFMRSDNGSTTGYNIIAERLI